MKKYILMLGVAGVLIGSYCAYAGNTATMTVTATIAHDVSLSVTHDLNMGTITVNPGADWSVGEELYINPDGTLDAETDNIISYSGFSAGTFTANVPDSCKVDGVLYNTSSGFHPCFELKKDLFLGNTVMTEPYVIYVSGNTFKFMYDIWGWNAGFIPISGNYSDSVTIEYTL
ncbi:MAG: hypothetical protein IJ689_02965 [Alphaproteobacteria bacterium]|nr:hypothetical protein [Alphaproteobacteria bacterium]